MFVYILNQNVTHILRDNYEQYLNNTLENEAKHVEICILQDIATNVHHSICVTLLVEYITQADRPAWSLSIENGH